MTPIVFIVLPIPFLFDQKRNAPLGVMYVASQVEGCVVVDLRGVERSHWLEKIPEAKIYGISSTSLDYDIAVDLAKMLRAERSGLLMLGGAHATVSKEGTIDPIFDIVVRGEGEQVIKDFMKMQYVPAGCGIQLTLSRQPILSLRDLYPAREKMGLEGFASPELVPGQETPQWGATIIGSRGCPYNCAFCLPKGTLVLTAELKWVPIEDLKVGDRVIGTNRGLHRRKLTESRIRATFYRMSNLYKITTSHGTVYSSPEHPWLTHGSRWLQADQLKVGQHLRFISSPRPSLPDTLEYKMGYIAGVTEGDGYLKSQLFTRKGKQYISYRFRLVGDDEMVDAFKGYAYDMKIYLHEQKFNPGKLYKVTRAIVTDKRTDFEKLTQIVKSEDTPEFKRGFLAGFYDAEGGWSSAPRFHNRDEELKKRIEGYLHEFSFKTVRDVSKADHCGAVRVTGGNAEYIRLMSLIQPKVIHKRTLQQLHVHCRAKILSIERQEKAVEVYNLTTETQDFIADGFITHNCANKAIWQGRVTKRPVDQIVAEITGLQARYGIDRYRFHDDTITTSRKRIQHLCRELEPLGIIWRCNTRAKELDLETAKMMKWAGCVEVGFGMEAASDAALKMIGKRATVADSMRTVEIAKKAGIPVKVFMIIGLPGDFGDISGRFIKLMKETEPDAVNLNTLAPFPGSDIYEHPRNYGIKLLQKDFTKYRLFYGLKNHEYEAPFPFEYEEISAEELKAHRKIMLDYIEDHGMNKIG